MEDITGENLKTAVLPASVKREKNPLNDVRSNKPKSDRAYKGTKSKSDAGTNYRKETPQKISGSTSVKSLPPAVKQSRAPVRKTNTKTQLKKSGTLKQPKDLKSSPSMKVVFLGGLNQIGKNITAFECEGDIIIVDCGMAFPDGEMLGVDRKSVV